MDTFVSTVSQVELFKLSSLNSEHLCRWNS